jgi:hypothetical protein
MSEVGWIDSIQGIKIIVVSLCSAFVRLHTDE